MSDHLGRFVWWLCWPIRRYRLWRAERAHARFLRWLESTQELREHWEQHWRERGTNDLGRSDRWAYWRCTFCGYVKTYPKPDAGPSAPVCTYGHAAPQPMERVDLSARENADG